MLKATAQPTYFKCLSNGLGAVLALDYPREQVGILISYISRQHPPRSCEHRWVSRRVESPYPPPGVERQVCAAWRAMGGGAQRPRLPLGDVDLDEHP